MKINYFTEQELYNFCESRCISQEIGRAIFNYRSTKKARQRIFENPTKREKKYIIKQALKNTSKDFELFWGDTIKC